MLRRLEPNLDLCNHIVHIIIINIIYTLRRCYGLHNLLYDKYNCYTYAGTLTYKSIIIILIPNISINFFFETQFWKMWYREEQSSKFLL